MSGLFELAMPWWEFVLRATVVYFVVLAMVRLSGKRTVGQFTPFDLLVHLARGHGTVLLPGVGFAGPDWTVRVSLANLPDDNYSVIGNHLVELIRDFHKYQKQTQTSK